jgi:glutamate/tyrosine decarboxylase-like PLP-dependent enzyme
MELFKNNNVMNEQLKNDLININTLLSTVKDQSVNFLSNINTTPTSRPKPALDNTILPDTGMGLSATMDYFFAQHSNKIVSSAGPRYWGFVTGGTTPAAIAGDWLTAVFDQNPQGVQGGSDIAAIIELETIQLLLNLFDLPHSFTGGFVTGATLSNFTGLAIGRQWAGLQKGNDVAREGIQSNIKVFSATPHSSAIKCLSLLGMGSNNLITVKTIEGNREAVDITDLEEKLTAHKDAAIIFISSGGTVNTVDFDDMNSIAALQKKYNFYWHIDAAFGGFAACSPEYKHLLSGWENADSITIDCHKWLNVPYDSAVYLVNKKHTKIQMATFQNSNAPYLGNPQENFSYLNFGPENSRRLRALPAWFSLLAYGKKGYQYIVENSITMAQQFGKYIEQQPVFELLAPVRLNTVCFTLVDANKVQPLLNKLNESGKVFMTPTVYEGKKGIRAAFVNWRTTSNDIQIAIDEMERIINEL